MVHVDLYRCEFLVKCKSLTFFLNASITNRADAYALILKHGFLNCELLVLIKNRC